MSSPGVGPLPIGGTNFSTFAGITGMIKPKRAIGPITADVTVEEQHDDELAITQHPVEKTADITDHAYNLPSRLAVKVGWSPAGAANPGVPFGDSSGLGDPVPLQTIYEQLLDLQKSRELLTVYTGKRIYDNMLIRAISVVTDQDSENALFVAMQLQEVILVETQTVTVPPNSVQKAPKKTGATLNAGTKSAQPHPPTINTGSAETVMSQQPSIFSFGAEQGS